MRAPACTRGTAWCAPRSTACLPRLGVSAPGHGSSAHAHTGPPQANGETISAVPEFDSILGRFRPRGLTPVRSSTQHTAQWVARHSGTAACSARHSGTAQWHGTVARHGGTARWHGTVARYSGTAARTRSGLPGLFWRVRRRLAQQAQGQAVLQVACCWPTQRPYLGGVGVARLALVPRDVVDEAGARLARVAPEATVN